MRKILIAFVALAAAVVFSAGCGGGGGSTGAVDNVETTYAGIWSGDYGNTSLGAMSLASDGEELTAVTTSDANGNVISIDGVVWNSFEGGDVTVFFDADGLPTHAVSSG